jgi:hypothetical protein
MFHDRIQPRFSRFNQQWINHLIDLFDSNCVWASRQTVKFFYFKWWAGRRTDMRNFNQQRINHLIDLFDSNCVWASRQTVNFFYYKWWAGRRTDMRNHHINNLLTKFGQPTVFCSSSTRTKFTLYVSFSLWWTMVIGLCHLLTVLMCENNSFYPTSLSH